MSDHFEGNPRFDVSIQCPRCGERHDSAVSRPDDDSHPPQDGDFGACLNCNGVYFYDSTDERGARPPTQGEWEDIMRNKDTIIIVGLLTLAEQRMEQLEKERQGGSE